MRPSYVYVEIDPFTTRVQIPRGKKLPQTAPNLFLTYCSACGKGWRRLFNKYNKLIYQTLHHLSTVYYKQLQVCMPTVGEGGGVTTVSLHRAIIIHLSNPKYWYFNKVFDC